MATRFVNIDRKTPMLLPPNLEDWVPKGDLAHFILDSLEELDLSLALVNERGCGSEQYPPAMMLAVLIYCYAQGIFSSRKIQQATYQNVAVRYLAANHHPDHDTIAEFRRKNGALIQQAFVGLLRLSRELKVLKLGNIALDGTKIGAATSKKSTRTYQQLEEELAELDRQVKGLLEQAEKADQAEPSPELPQELADKQKRQQKLREAKAKLEEQKRQAHEERAKERAAFGGQLGNKPAPLPKEPRPQDRINLSDPESTLTPTAKGDFIQGFNAQVAVATEGGLIVAADVVRDTNDIQQLEPMVGQCVQNGCKPQRVLVDSGYENIRQIVQVQKEYKVSSLCPPARIANARAEQPGKRPKRRKSKRWRRRMRQKLQTARGQALYRLRASTVEPVIGILKSALGFRQFLLRGLGKVKTEWTLLALAFNCKRLSGQIALIPVAS